MALVILQMRSKAEDVFWKVPNMAPVLGELAFFLGIVQPLTVRTRPDGDVQLLVLTKDDSYVLFDSYPEQVEPCVICLSMLV